MKTIIYRIIYLVDDVEVKLSSMVKELLGRDKIAFEGNVKVRGKSYYVDAWA